MPEDPSVEDYEAHVGSAFAVGDDRVLTLIEVTRATPQPGAPRPEPFSLTFTGDHELEQATYVLEHQELGTLHIFLVRVQPGAGEAFRYEAVFN